MTTNTVRLLRCLFALFIIWTYRPVIGGLGRRIGTLETSPPTCIPRPVQRLTAPAARPAMSHRCGVGEPGGFLLARQLGGAHSWEPRSLIRAAKPGRG
jgi:hypothetical protein